MLEIGKHGRQIGVGEALSLLKIGRLTGRESPIVDKADTAKRLSKDASLLIGGVEPVLVRPPDLLAHGRGSAVPDQRHAVTVIAK